MADTERTDRGPLAVPVDGEEDAVLHAERLRDGRVALGTRARGRDGEWKPGELHLLAPASALRLAAWLTPVVQREWRETVRARLGDQLATADDLYGDEPGRARRLAGDLMGEIPPGLLARGLVLLANSIGPAARERLVAELNATASFSDDAMLRRRLAEEGDAFAYVVAAAALLDAIDDEGGLDG